MVWLTSQERQVKGVFKDIKVVGACRTSYPLVHKICKTFQQGGFGMALEKSAGFVNWLKSEIQHCQNMNLRRRVFGRF